jgi:hypothetical protein
MKIDLTEREVPEPGDQLGVVADVFQTREKYKKRDKHYKALVIVGQLAATKSTGERFLVTSNFNLENSRDVNRLKKSVAALCGETAGANLKDFDPEVELIGKSFVTEPKAVDEDGTRELRFGPIKGYTGDSPIAVTADFVREKNKPQTQSS